MATQLKASLVRIVGKNGPVGSGFLVSKKHVLTCAHVVVQALGISSDTEEAPDANVRLNFPFSDLKETTTARIVCWKPVQLDPADPPDRTEDIAVLELESELPNDSYPSPVLAVDDLWGHPFRTFGFPAGYDDGVWASGFLRDAQAKGWIQIEDPKQGGYPVGPGFSGTPVWDEQTKAVVGMVVVADKRPDIRTAFMIPISTLVEAWPGFPTEVTSVRNDEEATDDIAEAPSRVVGDRINATRLFKTRDPQQEEVGQALANPSTRVVSVVGRAGIGKTTLASKVLNDLEQGRWPHTDDKKSVDGIVYLSTQSPSGISFAKLFLECGRMLGGKKKATLDAVFANQGLKTEEKARRLLEAMEGGLYVILLDDIEDLLDENNRFKDPELRAFFESSLRASDGTRLLVTSRVALSFPVGHVQDDRQIELNEGLSEKDAIAMLRELDPSGRAGLLKAKAKELRGAVKRVCGVPRALELIASNMIQNRLTGLDKILDRFYEAEEVVGLLFKQGYDQLDSNERKAMEALSVFGCSVPPPAVQFILNRTAPGVDALEVLKRLLNFYMANMDGKNGKNVSLHPLDREYVYNTLPVEGDCSRRILERLAAEYYKQQRKPRGEWMTIDDVQPHLREFEHRLKAEDYNEASAALSEIDVDFLIWRGGQAQRALNMREKLEGKLTVDRERMHQDHALGNIRQILGPLSDSFDYFANVIKLATQLGDKEIECRATSSIGESHRRLGQLDKAIEYLEQGVEMAGKLDDVKKHSLGLLGLGLACIYKGDIRAGIAHANRLIEISKRANDKMSEAQAYDCFSLAYLTLGRLEETIAISDNALAVYAKVNERNGAMYVLNVRGMAYLGLGLEKLSKGIDALGQARRMAHDDNYPRLEGFCLFNLACAYRKQGESAKAFQAANEASEILAEVQAAEAAAASALAKAIRASIEDRPADEALALVDCARNSVTAPDIYDSDYFAEEARKIAQSQGRADIDTEAQRIIDEKKRMLILPD